MLAIPHNGNLSNGRMFALVDFDGRGLTRAYAETRARLEPVYEVTQIKGDGEAHPFLSPNDEFAGFELWDKGNLDLTELKKPEMLQYEYARSGLKLGLKLEQELGVNPFKFGMIGSTDSHTSLATADEDNFFGKHSGAEPSPTRATHPFVASPDGKREDHGLGDGRLRLRRGLGHREHARGDLRRADAQGGLRHHRPADDRALLRRLRLPARRREDPQPRRGRLCARACRWAAISTAAPPGKAPSFLVAALKDPIGANLDRIQIVKGWQDANGALQEKVYDVAWGDAQTAQAGRRRQAAAGRQHGRCAERHLDQHHRRSRADHCLDRSGLRSRRCAPSTTRACIEIPTPRWTAYDAKYFGVQMPKEVPMIAQERAYTSPIWYTPKS